ncbi:MAG: NAD(P)H-dependent oxidoreductase [Pseudomonadota bacterium]
MNTDPLPSEYARDKQMLQIFIESLATTWLKKLNSIDLYQDPPPWYDESLFNFLWTTDNENDKSDARQRSETISYMLRHSELFNQAELLVIAAPVWNASVPAILKAWIDIIISPNYTYCFGTDGIQPLHRIKRVLWLISSGGAEEKVNANNHFLMVQESPFRYIGIPDSDVIWADRQESALFEDHATRLEQALDKVRHYAKSLTE